MCQVLKLPPYMQIFNSKTKETYDDLVETQNNLDDIYERHCHKILQEEKANKKAVDKMYNKRFSHIQKVPYFWSSVLIAHPLIGPMMIEEDELCLAYLQNLFVFELEGKDYGFQIVFYFDAENNPYFSNKELVKVFTYTSLRQTESQSTKIKWKANHDLIKQGKKRKRKKEKITHFSFFLWYEDTSDKSRFVGEIIKDEIWPNPMPYLLTPYNLPTRRTGKKQRDEEPPDNIGARKKGIRQRDEDSSDTSEEDLRNWRKDKMKIDEDSSDTSEEIIRVQRKSKSKKQRFENSTRTSQEEEQMVSDDDDDDF